MKEITQFVSRIVDFVKKGVTETTSTKRQTTYMSPIVPVRWWYGTSRTMHQWSHERQAWDVGK